jgi:hypothetical protein
MPKSGTHSISHGVITPLAMVRPAAMVVEHCGRPLPAHAGTSLDFHASLFELGKGQQHVQGRAAHGCRRIELLGHGDERDAMGVEQLDQLNEIRQRAGQPVDFVDKMISILRSGMSARSRCRAGRSVSRVTPVLALAPAWRPAHGLGSPAFGPIRLHRLDDRFRETDHIGC